MCLGVPMRVVQRNGFMARCEAKGIERSVSLFLVQHEDVGPGDHVMVHVGYAIQKMSEADASSAWQLYDAMLASEDETHNDA
jgi:hydrogenase expression/formation protein HypC